MDKECLYRTYQRALFDYRVSTTDDQRWKAKSIMKDTEYKASVLFGREYSNRLKESARNIDDSEKRGYMITYSEKNNGSERAFVSKEYLISMLQNSDILILYCYSVNYEERVEDLPEFGF